MGNLFSFSGRIGKAEFMKTALIFVAISVAASALQSLVPSLKIVGTLVGLALIWPWIVLWIKRYHDDGKSGWMCLVPIFAYIVLAMGISMFVMMSSGVDFMDPESMQAFSENPGAVTMKLTGMVVAAELLIIFLFNNMIKSDPEENRFGPATM